VRDDKRVGLEGKSPLRGGWGLSLACKLRHQSNVCKGARAWMISDIT
jgi:hypothetical protein